VVSDGTKTTQRLPLADASGGDDSITWIGRDRVLYHVEGHKQWRSIDLGTGAITPLTPGNTGWYFGPKLAPDGKRVAVHWNRRPGGVWTIDLADGSEHFAGGGVSGRPLGWSSDSKLIYIAGAKGQSTMQIDRLPATGGAPTPWLTAPISSASDCEFARDGKSALCVDYAAHGDLWLIENLAELADAR
jgi:hypothetical protein